MWIALTQPAYASGTLFFGAGSCFLIVGLLLVSWIGRSPSRKKSDLSVWTLAVLNTLRRRKRSLATISLLASATFLIVAIDANRLETGPDPSNQAGTGGFALLGETTRPIIGNLGDPATLESFGANSNLLAGAEVVPFRLREGDDASCLNLNRAQVPRILAVDPRLLTKASFRFTGKGAASKRGWGLLDEPAGDGSVPAIGDATSLQWALKKKVGETIDYTDERGRAFKVRIVGAIASSVLQGNLVIGERDFAEKFPGESGYRMFLVAVPSERVAEVVSGLSRAFQDFGMEMTKTTARLALFNSVQNTYLNTFQVLGALGLLLGTVGLGIVALRNLWERRGELAVLRAVGLSRGKVRRLMILEHILLLFVGLGIGVAAAVAGVVPWVLAAGSKVPAAGLVGLLALIAATGLIATVLAARHALGGNLLNALRNE